MEARRDGEKVDSDTPFPAHVTKRLHPRLERHKRAPTSHDQAGTAAIALHFRVALRKVELVGRLQGMAHQRVFARWRTVFSESDGLTRQLTQLWRPTGEFLVTLATERMKHGSNASTSSPWSSHGISGGPGESEAVSLSLVARAAKAHPERWMGSMVRLTCIGTVRRGSDQGSCVHGPG